MGAISNNDCPVGGCSSESWHTETALAGVQREKLKRWFWCAVFGQVYESAPNSKSAKDVLELFEWLAGGALPESITALKFDPKALRDITPRQRAIYRGSICLMLTNGTKDFHTQGIITSKIMNEEGIDDHHIFPADYLEKVKEIKTAKHRDCILNRTLIDRTTNQMINNRAPSKYLADIQKTPGFPFETVLQSHWLPTGADSPLLNDDYEGFLKWREQRLWQEIKQVTDIKEASDLESDAEKAE